MVEMTKPWDEMTQPERDAYVAAKKAERAAAKKAAAAEASPPPPQDEAVAAVIPSAEAEDRRRRLLAGVDAKTAALFTDDELLKMEREEEAAALDAQKKQAMTDVRAIARQKARVEHGLIASSVLRSEAEQKRLAEPVTFRVSLPNNGSGDPSRGGNGFRIDGRVFQIGQTYTAPRCVYESLLSGHYKAWLCELQFKTLDQHKPGNSAAQILNQTVPQFEIRNAA